MPVSSILSCQVKIDSHKDVYFCLVILQICISVAIICMYVLNPFETICGKSMIPFHAIWGLCMPMLV